MNINNDAGHGNMKKFIDFILEASARDNPINWTRPDANFEHHEVMDQHNLHQDAIKNGEQPVVPDWVAKRLEKLRDKKEWHSTMKRGTVVNMTARHVSNASGPGWRGGEHQEPQPSWRQSTWDPKKTRRAPTIYREGKKVQRPIYLRHPQTGEMHLIAGHHRSVYVTQVRKQPIQAHVIE